ncbi:MAG: PEGA domain-containing protein [Myxococcales bacterium]|nr:PEGA domain-containing protein [Myxococcales bacterium]
MIASGLALALALPPLFADASPSPSPSPAVERTPVAVIARRGDGEAPPRAAAASLRDGIKVGLRRGGGEALREQDGAPQIVVGACDEACRAEIRGALAVDYVLWDMVEMSDRDYRLHLELVDLRDGSLVAAFDERCPLCGLAEARDRVEDGAAELLEPLQVEPGAPPRVRVTSDPPEAEISVDGEHVGRAPITRVIPPGRHRVRARLFGYVDAEEEIEVGEGERAQLHLALGPTPPPPPPPPKPRVNGWIPLGLGIPAIAGGVVLAALDGRPPLGCGSSSGGCQGSFESTWPAVAVMAAGAALTSAGAILIHQARRARRAARAAKR